MEEFRWRMQTPLRQTDLPRVDILTDPDPSLID